MMYSMLLVLISCAVFQMIIRYMKIIRRRTRKGTRKLQLLFVHIVRSHCVSLLCVLIVRPHCVSSLCVLIVCPHCASSLCVLIVCPHCASSFCVLIVCHDK